MTVYVITTPYLNSNFFGVYSTIKRARIALEDFLASDENIVSVEDLGDYCYQFTTKAGEQFGAEIFWDVLDFEFEKEIVKEDE